VYHSQKEKKKKKKETEKEKTKSMTHIYNVHFSTSRPARHVGHATEKKRKDKKKKKRGEEGIQGDPLHATGSSMLVVSLWVEEGGRPHVKIVGGTWVGDAHDVGAGGCHRRQDLAMAWPVQLLAKQERGHVRMVFGCVSRGCTNAQDWEKRKEKKKKEKEKKKKHGLTESLYISFMPLAIRCRRSLCGSKGVVGCVPTTGHAQKLWGGRGHAQVMHTMWVQHQEKPPALARDNKQ